MNKLLLTVLLIATSAITSFAQIPSGYYNGTTGLNGSALKLKLHKIIRGHTERTYTQLWTDFQKTDVKSNGKVWDMYSDVPGGTPSYEFTFGSGQCGTYTAEGDCYNREHSFPKSWWGGGTSSSDTMYTDLFHLVPTDGYVNNKRSSYPYGEVGTASWTSTNGSKLGTSNYGGYTGTVFEPIDSYKGDFARAYFYMATRYLSKFDSWAPNTDMLDGSGFSSWALDLLLDWHHQDPVSQKEINRNDSIYTIQGNRNPFIDYPNWVDSIWNLSPSATAPVFSYGYPQSDNIASTSFDILVNQDKPGTAYYVVLSDGATAPTSAQVKVGQDASGTVLAANLMGSISISSASTTYFASISSLTNSTNYDVYVVSEDNASTVHLQASPTLVNVSTSGTNSGPTTIKEQNFESGNWSYSSTPGNGLISTTTNMHMEGTTSLKMTGSNGSNSDPYVTFDNVDISSYTNVSFEIAFAANGPDASDDLYLDISYDNGNSWTGTGSIKLIDGYSNANIAFGSTNSSNPTTVGSNPWTVSIANSVTQIMVRIRFDERSSKNNTSDSYYIDAIRMVGTLGVTNSNESIIEKKSGWSEPTNIAYATYSATSNLTTSNSIEVASFTIKDGGSDGTDVDAVSTKLIDISFTVTNYDNLAALAIFDGTTNVAEVTSFSSTTVSFSSLTLEAADEGTKDFTLRATYKTNVTDNDNLKFTISSATADNAGSLFAAADAGAATTDDTGNNNKIVVTADRLAFTNNNPPTSVDVGYDFNVEVEAVDVNNNRDLDVTSSLSIAKASGAGVLSSVTGLSQQFSSGVYLWSDVQYDVAGDFTISASASGLTFVTSSTITASNNTYFSDLMFTEYVEGSSNNKYLEIWNNTSASVDLSNYSIQIYYNGSTSPGTTVNLSGILAQDGIFVIANSSATVWSGTPNMTSNNINFNGDDAVVLVNANAKGNVDVIGVIGGNSNYAQDKTLERNATASGPNSTYTASEWDSKPQDDVSGLGTPGPLPIELVSFNGYYQNHNIYLGWQTASETNNDYFTIEKSIDAEHFKSIGSIAGAGNSIFLRNYEFIDRDVQGEGAFYYRLKQTDYDGKYSYSDALSVSLNITETQLLTQYIIDGNLVLNIQSADAQEMQIELLDLSGKLIQVNTISTQKGSNNYRIHLQNISNGIYLMRLYSDTDMIIRKLYIN